ncbi:Protein of unknown function (DUF2281) [Nostoc sp. PCC 7524]|uniref:hypothetical protein n=1 Tax=Nostoc sp. (strain ATCC 29411 / PCC 7524) TaxID=28072 RepID=UPI00029F1346|nr:hypothetical protein [Nostoc sp. PCC 7524]AFY50265.1 Protein of unknown function (DUF2281) [Nostoc sp. PCC 7524]
MGLDQELLTKWRSLPQDKQKQVLDFLDFLHWQDVPNKAILEERLQQIRNKIVNYGKDLYTKSSVNQKKTPYS